MNTQYQLVTTAEELRRAVDELFNKHAIGLDTETTELDPYLGRLRLIQLASADGVYIVDLDRFADGDLKHAKRSRLCDGCSIRRVRSRSRTTQSLTRSSSSTISASISADCSTRLLASQLVTAGDIEERHGLEAIAARYLNEAVDKTERLSNWEFELSEAQLEYAARDAAVLLPLREKLIERIKSLDLIQCAQLEFECVMPVVDIELDRVLHAQGALARTVAHRRKGRGELANELQEMLGEGVAGFAVRAAAREHQSRFAAAIDQGA